MATSTISAPPPISKPSVTLIAHVPAWSRHELAAHLGDFRQDFAQGLRVFGIDRNPAHRGELGDRGIHRFDGMRRIVPSSREQAHPECPRLLGDLAHAGCAERTPARSVAIRAMVRRYSHAAFG